MEVTTFCTLLDHSTCRMLQLSVRLPDAALCRKVEGGWTIGQVLQHLCLTERNAEHLLTTPSDRTAASGELIGAERLRQLLVAGRDGRVAAPDGYEPGEGFHSTGAFEREWVRRRAVLKRHLQSGIITVDRRIYRHPLLGDMTTSDWLHFLVFHADRHGAQIRQILSSQPAAAEPARSFRPHRDGKTPVKTGVGN